MALGPRVSLKVDILGVLVIHPGASGAAWRELEVSWTRPATPSLICSCGTRLKHSKSRFRFTRPGLQMVSTSITVFRSSTALSTPLHVEWSSKVDDAVQNAGSAMEALRKAMRSCFKSNVGFAGGKSGASLATCEPAPGRSRELHPASRLQVKATGDAQSDRFLVLLIEVGVSPCNPSMKRALQRQLTRTSVGFVPCPNSLDAQILDLQGGLCPSSIEQDRRNSGR